MTLNTITSKKIKEMSYEEYKSLIVNYTNKNGFNMPCDELIEFWHKYGFYINVGFGMFKDDIGIINEMER